MTDRERLRGYTVEEMVRDIHVRIIGDGTEDNPGLDKRVDRLERKLSIIGWVASTAAGAILLAFINWFWSKLTGKG